MRIQSHIKTNLKFYNFLAFLFLTIYLASDTISYKLVQLGPLLEPGPPFIFPVTYAISNIIAEIYGISAAKRLIWLTLFFQLIYALLIKFTIALPSPTTWDHQTEYNFVLGDILRFILSGTLA